MQTKRYDPSKYYKLESAPAPDSETRELQTFTIDEQP